MWAATAWDDSDWDGSRARGWTVMGRLRERQEVHRREAAAARRRQKKQLFQVGRVTAASGQADYEDAIKAQWKDGPSVLAFLFAPPDTDAIRILDVRGDYFDVRTGDTWDLFFPGYYRSEQGANVEQSAGAKPVGADYLADWYFNARDFDMLRNHVEKESRGLWSYSGGCDLVLINAWMRGSGEPDIDWASTISGEITDQEAGNKSLTVAGVVERISRDLETETGDASYGVSEVVEGPRPVRDPLVRDLFVNTLSGIAAALGARALGA